MQGFNMGKYVPPDQEGVQSGNSLHKKHALGARAAKLASHGQLTVRFEMPFAIWCTTCPRETLIGQGVRFNAAKSKVGMYHSSPIYSFHMRHPACGGEIEIRTDPQHTTYTVVAGARKRDTGDAKADSDSLVPVAGEFRIETERERRNRREGAFATLEKTIADRAQVEQAKVRIEELQDAAGRDWDDPYSQNQRLRKAFRVGRKEREQAAVAEGELKDRMSLGIDLVPATKEDALRASLVDFGRRPSEEVGERLVDKALTRPLFESSKPKIPATELSTGKGQLRGMLKADIAAARTRESLASAVATNTRLAKDPFLDPDIRKPVKLAGLKRKAVTDEQPPNSEPATSEQPRKAALVGYTSSESD